jgi:hypothetical protein
MSWRFFVTWPQCVGSAGQRSLRKVTLRQLTLVISGTLTECVGHKVRSGITGAGLYLTLLSTAVIVGSVVANECDYGGLVERS